MRFWEAADENGVFQEKYYTVALRKKDVDESEIEIAEIWPNLLAIDRKAA